MADPQQTAADLGGAPASTDTDAAVARASKAAPAPTGKAAVSADAAKARSMADAQAKDFETFHRENPLPKQPDMTPFTQKMPEADPMRQFGSLASGLAILAGSLTRTPLTTALNASAEAMKAIRTGDLMAYQDAKDRWKENTDLAIKNAEWAQKGYDNAFALMKEKHAEGWAALKTVAALDGNVAALNQQDVRLAMEANNASTRNRIALDEHRERMDEFAAKQEERAIDQAAVQARVHDKLDALGLDADARRNLPENTTSQIRFQARNEVVAEKKQAELVVGGGRQAFDLSAATAFAKQKHPDWATMSVGDRNLAVYRALGELEANRFAEKTTAGQEAKIAAGPSTPEGMAITARMQATGEPYDKARAAIRKESAPAPRNANAMLTQRFMFENPNATQEQIQQYVSSLPARASAIREFNSGKAAASIRSFDVAVSHLAVMREMAEALQNGDQRTLNRLANSWAAEFGGSAPTNAAAVARIVGDEIVKAVTGGPGALADRQDAQNIFTDAKSPEQLFGAINAVQQLMGGQMSGLKRQYERATGLRDFTEPNRFMSPEAARVFETYEQRRPPAADSLPAPPTVATPAPAPPPPARTSSPQAVPPEGARTVTPKGVKAVWRNGRWVEDDGR